MLGLFESLCGYQKGSSGTHPTQTPNVVNTVICSPCCAALELHAQPSAVFTRAEPPPTERCLAGNSWVDSEGLLFAMLVLFLLLVFTYWAFYKWILCCSTLGRRGLLEQVLGIMLITSWRHIAFLFLNSFFFLFL